MYICELSRAYIYPVRAGAHEGQKAPDPLELEFHTILK